MAVRGPNPDIRPVVSEKALALWLYIKRIPTNMEIVKQVKSSLGGKRVQYFWIDTWADSENR